MTGNQEPSELERELERARGPQGRDLGELGKDASAPLALEWILVVIVAVLPMIGAIFYSMNLLAAFYQQIVDVVAQPFG